MTSLTVAVKMSEQRLSRHEEGELLAEKFAGILKQHKQQAEDRHIQDQQNAILWIAAASLLSILVTLFVKDYLDKREQQTYPEPVSEMAGYYHGY